MVDPVGARWNDPIRLNATRGGFVITLQVSQVPLNSLALDKLEDRLYAYLDGLYSAVRRGPSATTLFHISLG